jgi:hypothetical protein
MNARGSRTLVASRRIGTNRQGSVKKDLLAASRRRHRRRDLAPIRGSAYSKYFRAMEAPTEYFGSTMFPSRTFPAMVSSM